jgi:hypothetical protein
MSREHATRDREPARLGLDEQFRLVRLQAYNLSLIA